jgi:hypothetical protein
MRDGLDERAADGASLGNELGLNEGEIDGAFVEGAMLGA